MRIYLYSFIVFLIVLIGHTFGVVDNFYMKFFFYDILMHISGGIGMGLLVSAFLKGHFLNFRHRRTVVILFVLFAGIIWELFEVYYNIAGYPFGTKAYYLDTIKDLFDDVLGGCIVAWLVKI